MVERQPLKRYFNSIDVSFLNPGLKELLTEIGTVGVMIFQPDIVVTGPDGISLVVEVKTSLPNPEQAEAHLQRYMISMQCPTGILVTRERMWLYRDLYTSPPSIGQIGEFDMKGLWQQQPPEEAASFEIFVQQWLERLSQQPTKDLPRNVVDVLREYVLPAVTSGEVRAAHPRYS
jgi:hypothetical protein